MKKPISHRKFLTRKKNEWGEHFKPKVLKGEALNPSISDAKRYEAVLQRAINGMTAEVDRRIKELFKSSIGKEYFAMDDSIGSQARILTNFLTEKYNAIFADLAKPVAQSVANNAAKSSASALNYSLKELSGGLTLKTSAITPEMKQILNATITENVALIKSISEKYLNGVQQAVMRSITTGNGLKDLVPYLESAKGMTKRRANLIALDQTRKAFNNMNMAKMEDLGLKEFEWLHTGGSAHPRKLHQELSGKIFSLDNLPIIGTMYGEEVRGIPGQLPYCRCRMKPVVKPSWAK